MNYIVAVSGGVDSVVLLDMLVNGELKPAKKVDTSGEAGFRSPSPDDQLVVAHFDHGIRENSSSDAEFVGALAKRYGLPFELGILKLGKETSEERARDERYNFLQQCRNKYNAPSIILAHHQDDVVETAIINMIRGTSWRGLSSLESTQELMRPLLTKTKAQLTAYAQKHNLQWVEDSTNTDQSYLRNYVRHTVIPRAKAQLPSFSDKIVEIVRSTQDIKSQVNQELIVIAKRGYLSDKNYRFSRYNMIMWPANVAKELIYYILTELDHAWHPTTLQINKVLHFAKTAQPGKKLEVSKSLKIHADSRHIEFKKY